MKLLLLILLVLAMTSCSSLTKRLDTAEAAAFADTATTELVLRSGGQELNPLGFPAVTAGKVLYLTLADSQTRERLDPIAKGAWYGFSVNNLLQYTLSLPLYLTLLPGLAVGILIYTHR